MSVVGFDIGSQFCYIAVARHGGVEMATNEYSDRASPSMVGLGEKCRTMGTSARNQLVMNPKSTVWGFMNLIGRPFSDPFVQQEVKQLPYEIVQHGKDGVGIKVPYGDSPQVFSPEQVMGMLMTYLKKIAETALSKPVSDCVISVPSFYTDAQRRALLDASIIAGLTCLRLMNDTTATALAYGIYKQDLPAESEKPRNVAFVDMGHSYLQVAICSFHKGKLKVLSKASDPYLGGRDFTQRLVTHFKADFSTRYKLTTLDKPRPTLRLLNECEKLKKNLSANTTSIPINIDCLAEDKDVTSHMNRVEFNELCADLLKRARAPLESALAKSHLKVEDIDSVEVVGGCCRLPAIKEIISDVFKKELSMTLNMDEAVARGCVLQCAMLSPTFKVRDFSISDTQPYPIRLQWQTFIEGEDGEMVVFKEGDTIYHSKILSFYRKKPFDLVATYQQPSLLPYPTPDIGTFSVRDVKPTETGEASKVKVKVRMSIHGIFFIKSATMVEKPPNVPDDAMETEKPPNSESAPAMASASTDTSDLSQGSDEQAPPPQTDTQTSQEPSEQRMDASEDQVDTGTAAGSTPDQQENGTQTTPTDQQEATPTPGQEGAEPGKEGAEPGKEGAEPGKEGAGPGKEGEGGKEKEKGKQPEAKKPKKPAVKYTDLPIGEKTVSLGKKQLDDMREKEVNMNYQDQLEKQKIDAKNAVEEYVYSMRDKLSYALAEFTVEKEKEAFLRELSATEDWLYDEGEDQPKKVYVKRLEELQKTGNLVVAREQEWRERPRAFEELAGAIVHFEKILTQYRDETNETYRHIEEAEMKKVEDMVNAKRAWMNTKQHAASQTPKYSNPPVRCSEIRAEKSNMESSCNPIVTKPKPKVEPPKDTAAEKKEGEGEAGKMEGEAGKMEGEAGKMEGEAGKMEGEAGKMEGAGGEGESGAKGKGGDMGTQVTEEKMEDDAPKVEQTEDMDLD